MRPEDIITQQIARDLEIADGRRLDAAWISKVLDADTRGEATPADLYAARALTAQLGRTY